MTKDDFEAKYNIKIKINGKFRHIDDTNFIVSDRRCVIKFCEEHQKYSYTQIHRVNAISCPECKKISLSTRAKMQHSSMSEEERLQRKLKHQDAMQGWYNSMSEEERLQHKLNSAKPYNSLSEDEKEKWKIKMVASYKGWYNSMSEEEKIAKQNKCLDWYNSLSDEERLQRQIKTRLYFKENVFIDQIQKIEARGYEIIDEYVGIKNNLGLSNYYNLRCKACGNVTVGTISAGVPVCRVCNPTSKAQSEIFDFILSFYNGKIIQNSRNVISPLELDIYLPDLNLAFEYNSVYYHSDLNKNIRYHQNKTFKALEKNVKLYHIWEYDWLTRPQILKSMILNKLGLTPNKIYARTCEILEVNNSIATEFYNNNHIFGGVGTGNINLGLFYNGTLVSLASFKKHQKFQWENVRFASIIDTTVVGGFSRLLKFFIKSYNPKSIITYADVNFTPNYKDCVYSKNNFEYLGTNKPNYCYVKDNTKYNKRSFRRDNIRAKFPEVYSENKSETVMMTELGFSRVYNAGIHKFLLTE